MTAELVRSKGVVAVLVEGDWPPAFRANAYALGYGSDPDAGAALADFQARFPAWMWHNRETAAFLEGLRAHNAALPPNTRAGFLGVDMYALFQSAAQVIRYLEAVGDADAARRARRRYACFTMVAGSEADAMHYAYGLAAGARGCEQQAVDQLVETLQRAASARPDAGAPDRMRAEQAFSAAANARAVASAESYYRAMVEPSRWVGGWGVAGRGRKMIQSFIFWLCECWHLLTLDRLPAAHSPKLQNPAAAGTSRGTCGTPTSSRWRRMLCSTHAPP